MSERVIDINGEKYVKVDQLCEDCKNIIEIDPHKQSLILEESIRTLRCHLSGGTLYLNQVISECGKIVDLSIKLNNDLNKLQREGK